MKLYTMNDQYDVTPGVALSGHHGRDDDSWVRLVLAPGNRPEGGRILEATHEDAPRGGRWEGRLVAPARPGAEDEDLALVLCPPTVRADYRIQCHLAPVLQHRSIAARRRGLTAEHILAPGCGLWRGGNLLWIWVDGELHDLRSLQYGFGEAPTEPLYEIRPYWEVRRRVGEPSSIEVGSFDEDGEWFAKRVR